MLAACPRIVALGVSIASLEVNVIVTVLPTVARVDVELLDAIATDVRVGPEGGGGGGMTCAYAKPGAAKETNSSAITTSTRPSPHRNGNIWKRHYTILLKIV